MPNVYNIHILELTSTWPRRLADPMKIQLPNDRLESFVIVFTISRKLLCVSVAASAFLLKVWFNVIRACKLN